MNPRRNLLAALSLCALAGALDAQNLPTAAPIRDPRAQAEAVARDLDTVSREVASLEEESRRLNVESQGLEPRRNGLRGRARYEARWLYHMHDGDALVARGGPEMLLDHAARAGRLRSALHATLRELKDADDRAVVVRDDRQRVESLLAAARVHMGELQTAQRAMVAALGPAVGVGGATGPSVTVYGGAGAFMPGVESFAASAGRMLFPIGGRAEVRRAWREGGDGPGVEISATLGAPVRAIYDGRVAFADRYGAYGQIVILEHGDRYHTVSANLGRIDVHVGQEVTAGTVLGSVGDEGGRGPLLYFEVRHGAETLDPVPWLGL